jgi:hypothetical protein
VEVGLADDDGARVAQLLHHERVATGLETGQRERAGGRRHIRRRVIVLHDDRDAVQRSADPAGAALGVERVSLFQCVWIQRDHRVQARTILVVRLDAREVLLDKIVRGDGADPLRGEQLDNGLLGDIEGGRRSRGRQRTDQTDLRSLCSEGRGSEQHREGCPHQH